MRPRPVVGPAAVPDAVRRLLDKFEYPDRETPDQVVPILPTLGSAGGGGAFVHLTRGTTQSIPAAGATVSWDTLGVQGFSGFAQAVPTSTVTIPVAGYYNLNVMFGWTSFNGGMTVTVLKNGVAAWPADDDPGLWSPASGLLFEGTAHAIDCVVGDTLSVNINPDDVSAQELASATLTAYLVDRSANEGAYRELVMSHGPIAYWRLGESTGTNAADETGTHDATYTNAPTLGVAGVMRDGSDDTAADLTPAEHIAGQDWATMDFDAGAFSVECWFNADAIGGATSILVQKRTGAGVGWELGVSTADIFFAGNGVAGAVRTAAPSINTDYHVVATSDGTTERMYLNGVEVDSDTAMTITANVEVLSIGYDVASAGFALNGTIDEVALYDRQLSGVEIADHYRVGTGG